MTKEATTTELPAVKIEDVDQTETTLPPAPLSRLDRVKHFSDKIKHTGKKLIDQGNLFDPDSDDDSIFGDAAFNPQMVLEASPHNRGAVRDKLNRGAKFVAEIARNPKRAVRDKYTRRAAANISQQPQEYLGVYDRELLSAHDALNSAIASSASSLRESTADEGDQSDIEAARLRIRKVEEQRDSRRSAWILGRHVVRAKVVRSMQHKPQRLDFVVKPVSADEANQTDWPRYLAKLSLWYTRGFTAQHIDDYRNPPFDLRELALTVERLAVISAPWQSFLVDLRHLYLWNDPQRTTYFMICFWVLWYFEQIMTFVVLYGMYLVMLNKYYPSNIASIRERLHRSEDQEANVKAWNELIQKHGNQDWIEPLLDKLGPMIQMQLGDLASFLEVLQNFYRWERPQKTAATLFFFAVFLLLLIFTSTEFCARLFWFAGGCIFFYSFPIATRYPKYRHVVSPINWIFWDIPNSADLAIIQLQEKTVIRDAARVVQNDQFVSTTTLPGAPRDLSAFSKIEDRNVESDRRSSFHSIHNRSRNLSTSSINSQRSTSSAMDSYTFRAVLHKPLSTSSQPLDLSLFQHTHSRLTITRNGIWVYNAHTTPTFRAYTDLLEIRKVNLNSNQPDGPTTSGNTADGDHESDISTTPSSSPSLSSPSQRKTGRPRSSSHQRIKAKTTQLANRFTKWTALQFLPSGLEFHFLQTEQEHVQKKHGYDEHEHEQEHEHEHEDKHEREPFLSPTTTISSINESEPVRQEEKIEILTLVVSEADRDKIFSLVLSWSNLKWRSLFSMDRQNRLDLRDAKGRRQRGLDDAIKQALR